MKNLFFIFSLFSFSSFAKTDHPWAQIIKKQGVVKFKDIDVKQDEMIMDKGILETGPKSFVKFKVSQVKNTIILGPNSKMDMVMLHNHKTQKHEHIYTLTNGICRWISGDSKVKDQKINTPHAAIGVRGTDYYLSTNDLLGETEIIVFDGQVNFESKLTDKDEKLISKNQWGGVGGRFGNKIGKILNLDQKVIETFKSILPIE